MIVGAYTVHLYCDNKNTNIRHYMIGDNAPSLYVWRASDDNEFKNHMYLTREQAFEFVSYKNEASCLKQARKAGWKISKNKSTVLCPACAKLKKEEIILEDG